VKRVSGGAALAAAAFSLSALSLALPAPSADGSVPAAVSRVALHDELPSIPRAMHRYGTVPTSQVLHLDVVLAGQDPAGLAEEVDAISTPGSPQYHQYLTPSEFAARYGPSPAEVQDVSSTLRSEGLSVGSAAQGSELLPVSGNAGLVSSVFATPLERVGLSSRASALVNTAEPEIPAALSGDISGIVGMDGLAQPHSMLRRGTRTSAPAPAQSHALGSHDAVSGPQACPTAASAAGGTGHTSTELATDYGLSDLLSQGRTGIGETIGVVEFEQFSPGDISTFEACYVLDNPIRTVTVDATPSGPAAGSGESALDIEMAAVNAPSATILVYEAPNEDNGASSLDLYNRIAADDLAQTITTSWGICEEDNTSGDAAAEDTIFARMATQGQTMVAAAGDEGSEDCFASDGGSELAVDDPGSQPDVTSVGGTTLVGANVAAQSVWNNCGHADANLCQDANGNGSGGGGYSDRWSKPPWQPGVAALTADNDECGFTVGCRSVPDLSGDGDPGNGVVAYYSSGGGWVDFGGTSAVAPMMAGFFADTNQGCKVPVGMVAPSLYANDNSANFTDITVGENDFTATNGGLWGATKGYDPASGLGTPDMANLSTALQGGDGCPSVTGLSASSGPEENGAAITVSGGGLADASAVSFGSAGQGQILSATPTSLTVMPPSPDRGLCVDVTVSNPQGISATLPADRYAFGSANACEGYRFVASDGGIFDFGTAAFEGSTGAVTLAAPIVGMATSPTGNGYWLAASDGGIFAFGDARYFGSTGNIHLNKPIVGMAATPDGNGYWLVASDGGIFTFGSAHYFGSTGNIALKRPIVGMAATPDGGGYWLVASDGGVFSFGDAFFHGSAGGTPLHQPIVGMAATPDGQGYWLVASDGGIFAYGDARYYGSTGNIHLNKPIVGMAASPTGGGYWLVASDGGIFSFGDATFYGSTGNISLNRPIVGMAPG
jgi:pro-kumamolisin-like protein